MRQFTITNNIVNIRWFHIIYAKKYKNIEIIYNEEKFVEARKEKLKLMSKMSVI